MTELNVIKITDTVIHNLKAKLLRAPKVFSFSSDLELSSWLVSYGIAREVGTVNDELSRFIFDAATGTLVQRQSLKAEMISFRGNVGIRISSKQSSSLEVRIPGFRDLVHPHFSENADGSYHHIVLFPELITKIAALEGVELVIVKPWALNSMFGGFESTESYYATNFWELNTNDSTLFADLLVEKKLAFLGTHDLIAHVAGLKKSAWEELPQMALHVRQGIVSYLGKGSISIPNLVLPYTAGVILDDLAQPPSYQSYSHRKMLREVLQAMIATNKSDAKTVLLKFPLAFEKVIRLSREPSLTSDLAKKAVTELRDEVRRTTLAYDKV